ncbi:uncharacterized skeletal organic matrix protein 3-like isoform X4 [Montipora capricornis]|uniref:uncharacterized skeletal organic matrix protein 3-like isoform X4 n=1 Tax=Montipora capricornis TaxID=246305 RepID=UPI0035F1136F
MKICGFQKLSVFFGHIFVVFLMSNGINGFTVVRSTTTIGTSNADRFSNPSCGSLDCLPRFNGVHGSSGCGSSDCCFCECDHNSPTFLILNHDNRCVPNDEIDEACSSDDSPLRVADITKSGQVIVTLHDPQFCRTGWTLQQWSHGVSGSQWTIGPQNFFSIKQVQESVNILVLSWSTGLDAKYSGLILKVQFSCRNSRSQCLLMKSKGNYTIPGTSPSLKPSDLAVDVTGKKAKPTNISGISSGSNEQSRAEPPAKTQRKLEGKQTGIVVAGVTISLAAGFVLAFATLLLFKRKQKEAVVQGRRRPNAPSKNLLIGGTPTLELALNRKQQCPQASLMNFTPWIASCRSMGAMRRQRLTEWVPYHPSLARKGYMKNRCLNGMWPTKAWQEKTNHKMELQVMRRQIMNRNHQNIRSLNQSTLTIATKKVTTKTKVTFT